MDTLAGLNAEGLWSLWSQPVGGEGPGEGYYRPLAMTLLSLLGRVHISLIHLLVAGLHVLSSVLLLRLLRPLPGAAVAAGIFAVHPLSSEVLGWASALPDALAVCLGLLAATGGPAVAGAATLAALLSKESALLILPALVLAGRAPKRLLSGWLAAVLLWAVLRISTQTGSDWQWADRLHLLPTALLWPVSSMAIPYPLTAVRDLLSAPAWVVPLGAVLIVGMLWRGRGERAGLVGVGLVLMSAIIALPPTLDGYLAAERYAYVGLIGLALWSAACLSRLPRWLLGVGGAASLALHVQGGIRWSGDVALFSSAARALPGSSYSWHLLGYALAREGRFSEAADAFGAAIETGHPYPDDPELRLISLVQAGRAEEAVVWAEAGPTEGLTATWIAWWARAAHDTGDHRRAQSLLLMLYDGERWDGPPWVEELADQLNAIP